MAAQFSPDRGEASVRSSASAAAQSTKHNDAIASSTRLDSAPWIPLIVDRIVRGFQPLAIVLFGSQARGESRWDSDVDLLVVLPTLENKRRSAIEIMRSLRDLPAAVDVFVTTPDEIARRGDSVDTILRPALREGSVLYAAQ